MNLDVYPVGVKFRDNNQFCKGIRTWYKHTKKKLMRESIRKLSNFIFQWKKTLYQNNLNNIAFFLTFFKGYRCN